MLLDPLLEKLRQMAQHTIMDQPFIMELPFQKEVPCGSILEMHQENPMLAETGDCIMMQIMHSSMNWVVKFSLGTGIGQS